MNIFEVGAGDRGRALPGAGFRIAPKTELQCYELGCRWHQLSRCFARPPGKAAAAKIGCPTHRLKKIAVATQPIHWSIMRAPPAQRSPLSCRGPRNGGGLVPILDHEAVGGKQRADLRGIPTGDLLEDRDEYAERVLTENGSPGDLHDV